MAIARMFDPYTGGAIGGGVPGGGGGSTTPPTPPAATSEAVASGGSPSAKTFGSFTDPDGVIASYSATLTNVVGATTVSGSGLGPYTFSGTVDGDSFALELDALNGSGQVVATAVHAVDVAAAAGGASLETLVDFSSVASYNFLTQGGSSGTGGQGAHTVNGVSWDLDYLGSSGPTRLEIVNGVLYHETSGQNAMLNAYMGAGGLQTGYYPIWAVCSIVTPNTQCLMWGIAQNLTNANQGNEAQFLLGTRSTGAADATSLLTRENTTGAPAFLTVKAWDFNLANVTTTPTRMGLRIMGGSWQPSWDQGTATLPSDLRNLSNVGGRQYNDFNNANTPQNRNYLFLSLFADCDVRVVAYRGDLT